MSDEYVWSDLRDPLIEHVGTAPPAHIEERILVVFSGHPALVAAAIEHVQRRYDSGMIRSPWPVLAKHAEEAVAGLNATDVRASAQPDRDQQVRRARHWIIQAGYQYDRLDHVEDELFGERGIVPGCTDDVLRAELIELWRAERPRGEQVEREAIERAERWKAANARMKEADRQRARSAEVQRAQLPVPAAPKVPSSGNPFIVGGQ